MKVISRDEAFEKGLRRYYTGIPCKKGHISERSVSTGGCVTCRSEWDKEWREKNKERMRENQRKWRARNPDKLKEYKEKYQHKGDSINLKRR